MTWTRITTVVTGYLAANMPEESKRTLAALTSDLVNRISDIFLACLARENIDPEDYIGEKLGIVITLAGAEEEEESAE